jgi:uncharacterized protein (TIGR03067 family)
MKTTLHPLLLVCASLCGTASCAPKADDQASIQGVWLAQTESQNGHTKKVTYQYHFSGNTVNFIDENGKEMKYTFKLDTTRNPNLCILQPVQAPADSKPVSVAYKLNGDSLTIVVAPPDSVPTELSDRNNQELIICRRETP